MAKKRFTEEQIVGILKEAQTGIRTEDLCRKYNVSTNTFYNWRQKYAGMEVSDVRRLKCLEDADFGHAEGCLGLKARGSSVHAEAHRSEATLSF